jgi:hypothetical protein
VGATNAVTTGNTALGLAGASFAAMSGSATSKLSTLAGYSACGAFWFLVSAIALTVRGRSGR